MRESGGRRRRGEMERMRPFCQDAARCSKDGASYFQFAVAAQQSRRGCMFAQSETRSTSVLNHAVRVIASVLFVVAAAAVSDRPGPRDFRAGCGTIRYGERDAKTMKERDRERHRIEREDSPEMKLTDRDQIATWVDSLLEGGMKGGRQSVSRGCGNWWML